MPADARAVMSGHVYTAVTKTVSQERISGHRKYYKEMRKLKFILGFSISLPSVMEMAPKDS